MVSDQHRCAGGARRTQWGSAPYSRAATTVDAGSMRWVLVWSRPVSTKPMQRGLRERGVIHHVFFAPSVCFCPACALLHQGAKVSLHGSEGNPDSRGDFFRGCPASPGREAREDAVFQCPLAARIRHRHGAICDGIDNVAGVNPDVVAGMSHAMQQPPEDLVVGRVFLGKSVHSLKKFSSRDSLRCEEQHTKRFMEAPGFALRRQLFWSRREERHAGGKNAPRSPVWLTENHRNGERVPGKIANSCRRFVGSPKSKGLHACWNRGIGIDETR